jgi:hypothetical protein
MKRDLLIVLAFVLLLRVPFLNQAIQGDDLYYIAGGQHALIDPAHPNHAKYVFQGEVVDMRGHPHPPLNAWVLGLLLAALGDVYEVPFHAFYVLFSLIAALSMYALARRFSPQPLWATLLFCAVPAFVVNGNSLESDLPFLAFWMAGFAAFVHARYALAAIALALAAMAAYQAVVATPILAFWCWLHARRSKAAWAVALTPVLVIGAYQLYERSTGGVLPAQVLSGYFVTYALQTLRNKALNAAALIGHLGWIVFPALAVVAFRKQWIAGVVAAVAAAFLDPHPLYWASAGAGAMVLAASVRNSGFPYRWIALYFAASLVLFFAGSARYLLPLAAPVAILVSELPRRLLWVGLAGQLAVWVSLAVVNYAHWDGYRKFAHDVERLAGERRTWVNGEWGLRFYAEALGAMPVERTQPVRPGDVVLSSALGFPVPITTGGGRPVPMLEREINAPFPLRLLGLDSKSGYSTVSLGVRPFGIHAGPIDRVRAEVISEQKPVLSSVPMSAPEADRHIVSGIYQLEEGWYRWMGARAVVLLNPPARPAPIRISFYLSPAAPARRLTVSLDGRRIAQQALSGSGPRTIETPPAHGSLLILEVDRTFRVAGDNRDLGVILTEAGYVK